MIHVYHDMHKVIEKAMQKGQGAAISAFRCAGRWMPVPLWQQAQRRCKGQGGEQGSSSKTHLDVCVEGMGSEDGAGALIPLSLVLLKGGHIARVSVGQSSNGDGDIAPRGLHL